MGFITIYVYGTIIMSIINRKILLLSQEIVLDERGVTHKCIYM